MKKLLSIIVFFLLMFMLAETPAEAQILPTSMRITVLNSLGNPVQNAKVIVYETREDYENEKNAVAGPAFTDKKGRVTFKNLKEKRYFIQAVKDDMNNYGEGEETDKLKKGKVNKFNIIIS